MDLENFINNLSEEDFLQVVNLVEHRKAISDNKMTIVDFIEKYKFEISPRLLRLLQHEAKETKFVNNLLRAKLLRYKTIGGKTVIELEYILKKAKIDLTYFFSQPRIYLNDLDISKDS